MVSTTGLGTTIKTPGENQEGSGGPAATPAGHTGA